MTRSDGIVAKNANWHFRGDIALNFDTHVSKSVPYYEEGHRLICAMSDYFIKQDSLCYELGCSTGSLSEKLVQHHPLKPGARFVGIDREEDMIALASKKQSSNPALAFVIDDILQTLFDPTDLMIAYYTIHFIRPSERQKLLDRIYQALNWGGGFIMFEKVRAPDARFQDMTTGLYNDFKLDQGYTPDDIVEKSRSLKGVLEPFSSQGNIDLLKRAGFQDILTIFKYVCFEGFLAIK